MSLHAIVCLTYSCSIKSVGLNNIGTCFEIFLVYFGNDIGACEVQYIIITLDLLRDIGKQVAPEITFCQVVLLYHGSQCPIEHQYTLIDLSLKNRKW